MSAEWGIDYYDRISAALSSLGYEAPIRGMTKTSDAIKIIAEALEDILRKRGPPQHEKDGDKCRPDCHACHLEAAKGTGK